ncbi:formate dehydrogenase subunit alpha [Halococcus saccharolyticus]|uniref:Formate dehydrogenase subunit alpha n=1 Tax=Halococcus saccharolyticus DSM 5350 TaxID=1227455 RepID=M0MIB3_9EURY|nr:formate dehydrogenase subunit alpha [Halococcus saccharolyticus]EMA45078.1 formate dehydrogenase subunit alpha [Halococcus saccharolyticus DSM 5350]
MSGKPTSGSDTSDSSDTEKEGVAGFMSRAREQAQQGMASATESDAFASVEHAVEGVAANTMSEGRLFDVADALSDYRLNEVDVTDTTCGYCAVGCRFDVYSKDGEVLGTRPNPEKAPINGISTCVKGKFSYGFANSDDRLTQPLVKDEGEFREASWDEALSRVKEGLEGIQEEYGPDALGLVASSKATNEDNYVMQRFAREVLGTNNIDNCNRLCHAATVEGLSDTLGFGAASTGLAALEDTDCYVLVGSNTTEAHPVFGTRIKQNVRDGADLLVFDPRKTQIAEYADQFTRIEPGYDTTWINGMIRYILAEDLHDEAFIEERVDGLEKIRESVQQFTPEFVEEKAGVPPEELKSAAETIATADSCMFGWTLGLVEHSHGTDNIYAIANLALITGHVGHPKGGLSPFRGQNNVQGGGGDMGPLPNNFPGYQPVTDEENREKFADRWQMDLDQMPAEEGYRLTEMFLAADQGDLRGMFIQGENPQISEPNIGHATEVLEELEFLAVQDIFLTETAEYADVVLPATSTVESNGTYTSSSRHVQLVKRAIEPNGEAKEDWEITQALAKRFGYDWGFDSPSDIMDEIADLTPIYGGISHERLEEEGGLQWPCRSEDDHGTPYLYADEFRAVEGSEKAQMHVADAIEPGETPDEEFPLVMTSGRVLYQYHTGTMTLREEGLDAYSAESFVEINPETAAEYGVADGETVTLTSRHGTTEMRADITDRPSPGEVFVPMHYLEGGANNLTKEEPLDGPSRAPEFKVTDVEVTLENEPTDDERSPTETDSGSDERPAASDD